MIKIMGVWNNEEKYNENKVNEVVILYNKKNNKLDIVRNISVAKLREIYLISGDEIKRDKNFKLLKDITQAIKHFDKVNDQINGETIEPTTKNSNNLELPYQSFKNKFFIGSPETYNMLLEEDYVIYTRNSLFKNKSDYGKYNNMQEALNANKCYFDIDVDTRRATLMWHSDIDNKYDKREIHIHDRKWFPEKIVQNFINNANKLDYNLDLDKNTIKLFIKATGLALSENQTREKHFTISNELYFGHVYRELDDIAYRDDNMKEMVKELKKELKPFEHYDFEDLYRGDFENFEQRKEKALINEKNKHDVSPEYDFDISSK